MTAVVGAALLSGATAASAQVTSVDATVTPERVTFPTTRALEYRLRLVTGSAAADVRAGFIEPLYGHGVPGSPLDIGTPRVDGRGAIVRSSIRVIESWVVGCERGYGNELVGVQMRIPANTSTTLVVPARLSGSVAPWVDTSLKLGFDVYQPGHANLQTSSPEPLRQGPVGVRLSLRARADWVEVPAPPRFGVPPPAVERGAAIVFSGTSQPAPPNRRLTLSYSPPGRSDWSRLTRVRTDPDGRFRFSWTPARLGTYAVRAVFRPGQSGRLARDVSCSEAFTVVREQTACDARTAVTASVKARPAAASCARTSARAANRAS